MSDRTSTGVLSLTLTFSISLSKSFSEEIERRGADLSFVLNLALPSVSLPGSCELALLSSS